MNEFPRISPALLGLLAFHGRPPVLVGIHGDLAAPSRITNLDPDVTAIVPPSRLGVWLVERKASRGAFSLVLAFSGDLYTRGDAGTWSRAPRGALLTELVPVDVWKDERLRVLLGTPAVSEV